MSVDKEARRKGYRCDLGILARKGSAKRKRVEDADIPMQINVPSVCNLTCSPSSTPLSCTAAHIRSRKSLSNGSANPMWPTTPPSKNVHGLTYRRGSTN